ncbi:hypothetical protein BT93_E1364 [Corymbia citriodora subsp. variegata]|nr:hypothetical protein BT93_E1364 [Corymbia citriodora subsp. variegata]
MFSQVPHTIPTTAMASCLASSLFLKQLALLAVAIALPVASSSPALGCFDSILSFGDSLADTGNLLYLSSSEGDPTHSCFPPYGETYFHHPTGRYSDGRLVIDFVAQLLGLPFVAPYYWDDGGRSVADFGKGVNFAVAGATALDESFFEEWGVSDLQPNISLGYQLGLFKELLPSLCSTASDCNQFLANSLVLMGEIGGNDYNYLFFVGTDLEEIQGIVPLVIEEIASAITELIDLGAVTILVPGNFPIGCLPVYLTEFQVSDKEEYDPSTGCLNWLNEFSQYHNKHLQRKLDHLRELHPQANIIYVDYYHDALRFYQSPDEFGSMAEYSEHAVEEEEPTIITRQHCAIPIRRYAMTHPRTRAGTVSISRKQHTGGFPRAWRTVHLLYLNWTFLVLHYP